MVTNRSIRNLLQSATNTLNEAGCETPDIDARLLLQHITGLSHAQLMSSIKQEIDDQTAKAFDHLVQSRLTGKSVHRIIGYREFFGLPIAISKDTLEPRPDTEVLVERVIHEYPDRNQPLTFADIGTGTGAIAIALLKHFPNARGFGIDISDATLATAKRNAIALSIDDRFEIVKSHYLSAFDIPVDFLVSNPPYIPTDDIKSLPAIVRDFDPKISLDGGIDGLEAYRNILGALTRLDPTPERVFFEIGHDQPEKFERLANSLGWQTIDRTRDLQGIIRVMTIGRSDNC